ncbi:hypothetical protein BGZ96_008431 [Linnemannia gamsii]|uniref:F-box domain-containing protein n=1 Tax=Linnemannia gamsii TaxID=64522 RepID=A0ABQ7KEZ6_9FUNG|nr:hypothetical protein BGZ96_008431 [Linnemannia gamsii]
MSISTACEQFFDIPELPRLLTAFLELKDVSSLSRISRKMHNFCTPSLYRRIERDDWDDCKIWESLPALLALAQNVNHVKVLCVRNDILTYYYNCVLTFEELYSRTLGTPRTRPPWLPPYDIRTCQVVALPPMTRLSRLDVAIGPLDTGPRTMPSANDLRALLPQLCWLISQNPGLTAIRLQGVPILDLRGVRMFARALAGLCKLESLTALIECRNDGWVGLWKHIFFRLPPSLKHMFFNFKDCENFERYQDALNDQLDGWKGEEVEAIAERQEPLVHLEDLYFQGVAGYRWDTPSDLRAMFAHCPNLKKLDTDINVANSDTIETVGQLIAQESPKIDSLIYGVHEFDERMPFRIMSSLPAQQVTRFEFNVDSHDLEIPAMNLAIHQHSTTLRVLCFQGKRDIIWFSASIILKECINLETFEAPCNNTEGVFTTLADILEQPWGCIKLKQLALAIGGCELPSEEDVEPYYSRPSPITLNEAETEHLSRLEDLYRKVGALTGLEKLDLRMVPLDSLGEVDYESMEDARLSFPAMLNLPDPRTGVPGFLHHLAGLENLTWIKGSVWADTAETEKTIGWLEVAWMDRHWPAFRYAEVYPTSGEVSAPFEWLRERRSHGERTFWLYGLSGTSERNF